MCQLFGVIPRQMWFYSEAFSLSPQPEGCSLRSLFSRCGFSNSGSSFIHEGKRNYEICRKEDSVDLKKPCVDIKGEWRPGRHVLLTWVQPYQGPKVWDPRVWQSLPLMDQAQSNGQAFWSESKSWQCAHVWLFTVCVCINSAATVSSSQLPIAWDSMRLSNSSPYVCLHNEGTGFLIRCIVAVAPLDQVQLNPCQLFYGCICVSVLSLFPHQPSQVSRT